MFKLITPGPDWNLVLEQLKASGLYDIFYESAYVGLYNGTPEAFYYEHGDHFFFFPYLANGDQFESAYGYGGAVSSSTDEGFLYKAWLAFQEYTPFQNGVMRTHPFLSTRRFADESIMQTKLVAAVVWADLTQEYDKLFADYKKDTRRIIRKAREDEALSLSCDENWSGFATLYDQTMQRLDAKDKYYFDADYFQQIESFPPDQRMLVCIHSDEHMVAGAVVLKSDDYWHYHLAASHPDYLSQGVNALVLDEVIRLGSQSNASKLMLGGGRSADLDDGLLRFKQSFSPQQSDLYMGFYNQ